MSGKRELVPERILRRRSLRRAGLLVAAGSLVLAACAPARVVDRGPADRRQVTLTFDTAYDTRYTAAVLDVLDSFRVDATMFVTGEWAEAHPDLVRRMVDAGHLVANHSYDHPDLRTLPDEQIVDQIRRADAAISSRTGRTTQPWLRPPFGSQDARVNQVLGNEGYRYDVLWTVDSFGWNGLSGPEVVKRCLDRAAPGTIYMFHLAAEADLWALPWIIQALRDHGYQLVRLDAWYP